jgi:hypothetical protein
MKLISGIDDHARFRVVATIVRCVTASPGQATLPQSPRGCPAWLSRRSLKRVL